jgi:hypothetical protein
MFSSVSNTPLHLSTRDGFALHVETPATQARQEPTHAAAMCSLDAAKR